MTPEAPALLTALIDGCRRGVVTHREAARLVGIRKADFSDLVAWRMVEVAVWRCYEATFNRTFPECDARLQRHASIQHHTDNLLRGGPPSACIHYDAADAENLPPAHDRLQLSEPGNDLPRDNSYRCDRPPATSHRALPRDNWQQLFNPDTCPAMATDGPEFTFEDMAA